MDTDPLSRLPPPTPVLWARTLGWGGGESEGWSEDRQGGGGGQEGKGVRTGKKEECGEERG